MKNAIAPRPPSAAPNRTSKTHQPPPQPRTQEQHATGKPGESFTKSKELHEEEHSPVTATAHKLDGAYQAGDVGERTFEQLKEGVHKLTEGFHKLFGEHDLPKPAPSARPTRPVGTQTGKPNGLAGTLKPQAQSTALVRPAAPQATPAARPPAVATRPAVGAQPGKPGGLAGTLKAQPQSNSLLQRPGHLKGPGAPAEPSPTAFGKTMGGFQAAGGTLTAVHEGAEAKRAWQKGDGQGVLNHGLGTGSGLANATAGVATMVGSTAVAGPACALGAGLDGYKDLHEGFTKHDNDKLVTGGWKTAGAVAMAAAPMAGPAAPLVFLGGAATYGAAWATSKDGQAAIQGGLKAAGEFGKDAGAGFHKLGEGLQHLGDGLRQDAQTLLN